MYVETPKGPGAHDDLAMAAAMAHKAIERTHSHDPKTCRIYRCFQCAALKQKELNAIDDEIAGKLGCPECGSLSGHQKGCKGVAK
jgi:DNA-directed RNA polymerase subunit RPC12/RpoP